MRKLYTILAAGSLGLLLSCSKQPPIDLSTTNLTAIAKVGASREYSTTVLKAVLKERTSGRIVWEIDAKSGTPEIHTLIFKVGANNVELAHPHYGDYSIVTPSGGSVFNVDRNIDYELEIWGKLQSPPSRVVFRLPG